MITKEQVIEEIEQKYIKSNDTWLNNLNGRKIMIWGACERSLGMERYV